MARRVKDHIDISEFTSLDTLIRYLGTIRDNLPDDCEAEIRIRGDDAAGKRLTITYFREMSADELEREGHGAGDPDDAARIEALRRALDDIPFRPSTGETSA